MGENNAIFCILNFKLNNKGAQNFDVIRFATYRTASKLRFIQKKLNCK
jgi:hypothetical protein